jgi:hypothetical protein
MSDGDGGNVVRLYQDRVWVCQCGCTSFQLEESGDIECCGCGTKSTHGWWRDRPPEGGPPPEDRNTYTAARVGTDLALRRVQRRAQEDDVAILAVIKSTGAIHTWADIETDDEAQTGWAWKRLNDVINMIVPGATPKAKE